MVAPSYHAMRRWQREEERLRMRIVVCVKEVLDPDAVNSFALAGRLVIGDDGKSLTQSAIPRLMNALRRAGDRGGAAAPRRRRRRARSRWSRSATTARASCSTRRRSAPTRSVAIAADPATLDDHAHRARCSRRASVSAAARISCSAGGRRRTTTRAWCRRSLGERLGMPVVTIARAVELAADGAGACASRA